MKEMKSQRKDIPLALNRKQALNALAAKPKIAKTIVSIGKFARKFLHCASDTSYIYTYIIIKIRNLKKKKRERERESTLER